MLNLCVETGADIESNSGLVVASTDGAGNFGEARYVSVSVMRTAT
jgi:hypothetical protein